MYDLGHTPRQDGWTAARRRAFVDALAARRSVEAACAALGLSVSSAYRLRKRHPGFAAAWDAVRAAARRGPVASAGLIRAAAANFEELLALIGRGADPAEIAAVLQERQHSQPAPELRPLRAWGRQQSQPDPELRHAPARARVGAATFSTGS